MNTVFIKTCRDTRLAPYRSLKTRRSGEDGLFIVENFPSVLSLIESNLTISSCVSTVGTYEKLLDKLRDREHRCPAFYLLEKKEIENLIGFKFHQGIMMAAELPARIRFSSIEPHLPSPRLLIALDAVHDPQNVGLILRNVAAFEADAVIADASTHEPYSRKSARTSLGALFKIGITYEDDLSGFLKYIKKKGVRVAVPSVSEEAIDLDKADLSGDLCIVMGNEYAGASEEMIRLADMTVRIPHMFEKVDSLNVACASSVIMYQCFINRKKSG